MHPDLDPELARVVKRLPPIPSTRWGFALMRPLSALTPRGNLDGVEISKHHSSSARVRLLRPRGIKPRGALLWIHGGGLVVGAPSQDDSRCAEFARELEIVVACPYYRLAPRHRFPAALDDCRAAWGWLLDHLGELGVDSERVAVGGESAGGGLAASLAQRVHDEGGPQPTAQLLVYPMLDDRTAARRELDALKHPVWNNKSNRFGWSSYLGQAAGGPSVPEYSVPARRKDLGGLPPAWIGVGSLDLFLEENRAYAHALEESGGTCQLYEAQGGCHGFVAIAPDAAISRASTRSQLEFLRARVGLPAQG